MGLRNWIKQRKKHKADIKAVKEAKEESTRHKLEVADKAIELLERLRVDRRLNDLGPIDEERRAEAH